jgi:thiamine-monophosphate kinase
LASVSSLGELELIARLKRRVGPSPAWLPVGIGDDAAVMEPPRGGLDVITTDALVEDVHFRRAWTAPRAIGHKAVAVNFSDLAAMGAAPRAVFLSLVLPPGLPVADFDDLIDGVVTAAGTYGAVLAGGNLARSPGPLVVDVTAVGAAARRRVLSRAGGRPGDLLFVTGAVGAAATGLAMLDAGVDRGALDAAARACLDRYEQPAPRARCGRIVAASRSASAAIDLSDGLAEAARQLADASATGVSLAARAIPIHDGARAWAARQGIDPLRLALAGGEDYELLFAVPPRRRRAFAGALRRCADLPVTHVGYLTRERGATLDRDGAQEPLPAGFQHF